MINLEFFMNLASLLSSFRPEMECSWRLAVGVSFQLMKRKNYFNVLNFNIYKFILKKKSEANGWVEAEISLSYVLSFWLKNSLYEMYRKKSRFEICQKSFQSETCTYRYPNSYFKTCIGSCSGIKNCERPATWLNFACNFGSFSRFPIQNSS